MLETPILFLIFNRPDTTNIVFNAIKEAKPRNLFIAADGPRSEKLGEIEKCEETRKIVLNGINWNCEVRTLFQDKNLGCGKAVSEAITWFFNQVEMGIILEDDCLPSKSFFPFCEELLKKYRYTDNVFQISGDNFQNKRVGTASYYFSAYGHIWGWASWKRAWKYYNFTLNNMESDLFSDRLSYYFNSKEEKIFWLNLFEKMKTSPIDTWDYQWSFCHWYHQAFSIIPSKNLVSNIGFNDKATHTKTYVNGVSNLKTHELNKLKHPKTIIQNKKADLLIFNRLFSKKNKSYEFDHLIHTIKLFLKKIKFKQF
jgi:hypothetical protein